MKNSTDNHVFQTNLLQALQKNKLIQDKLTECQQTYYVQLLKDMQTYNVKEKYNKNLLYSWKRENYIRQLRKNLEEYKQKHMGKTDAFYEYQRKKLDNLVSGQQSVPIPPSEEERRLNIHVKYNRFLRQNPIQSANLPNVNKKKNDNEGDDDEEEEDKENHEEKTARDLEETWRHIHAQSAVHARAKSNSFLPNIRRSLTRNENRRKKSSAKISSSARILQPQRSSLSPVRTSNILISSTNEIQQSSTLKTSSNQFELSETMESVASLADDILDNHTHGDLISIRSVRRPRRNPAELNLLFETRKRIYQINKSALETQLNERKTRLQPHFQFERLKPNDSVGGVVENIIENIQKQTEQINQPDRIIT